MEAHVRIATRAEKRGFFRPFVCTTGGAVVYLYQTWRGTVTDSNDQVLFRRPLVCTSLDCRFSDGTSLRIELGRDGPEFDGHRLREEWPTPLNRILVAGERTIRVKPEDDTLMFDFVGARPPLDMAMMAFYIKSGEGDRSA